jgi:GT2 family glycosyltransferase
MGRALAALPGKGYMEAPMDDLSVIIPSYNGQEHLDRTLSDLLDIAPRAEVIVVDGGSTDGSRQLVRDQYPNVRLLEVPNHGFSHATNRGVEASTRSLVLLLNSDLFLNKKCLEAMADTLRRERRVGAVGPHLFNPDGTRQHHFSWPYWPRYLPALTGPLRVGVLCGACIMTRREVLDDVGGLDESFFLYNEELDWCKRVRVAGYRIQLLPVGAVHVGGGSTAPSPELLLERYRGYLYLIDKRHPRLFVESIRRLMHFKAWFYKRFDSQPEFRSMWKQLEAITERRDYDESPFDVSGRRIPDLSVRASEPPPSPVALELDRAAE